MSGYFIPLQIFFRNEITSFRSWVIHVEVLGSDTFFGSWSIRMDVMSDENTSDNIGETTLLPVEFSNETSTPGSLWSDLRCDVIVTSQVK